MSARKRRAARKIAMLVRMDATRSRMPSSIILAALGTDPSVRYWTSCMVPLAKAMRRLGLRERALIALDNARAKRVAAGGAV